MSTFTITGASKKKEVEGRHGPMQVITLTLADGRQAEWFTKASTPLPTPGQTLDGEVTNGQYGWSFKKAQQQTFGGPRPEDPDRQRRIIRQHSQTASIALIEMAVGLGIIPKPESSAALLDLVRKTADWLDKDVATTVANASLSVDDAARKSEEQW